MNISDLNFQDTSIARTASPPVSQPLRAATASPVNSVTSANTSSVTNVSAASASTGTSSLNPQQQQQTQPQPQQSQSNSQQHSHVKAAKRPKLSHTPSEDSAGSSVDAGQDSSMGEGEGPSESFSNNEIELVFKPHPTEMGGDNTLIKALKENSVRYIKTTANASGNYFLFWTVDLKKILKQIFGFIKSLIII